MKSPFSQFLLLILLLSTSSSWAQTVSFKKDIIYKNEVPYCKMTKEGFITSDYIVKSLDGKEAFVVRFNNHDEFGYTITFNNSLRQASMKMDFGFTDILAKEIVHCQFFDNGNYDPSKEDLFIKLHPYQPKDIIEQIEQFTNEELMPSSAKTSIELGISSRNNQLFQSQNAIGSFHYERTLINGNFLNSYTFKNNKGDMVAIARIAGLDGKTAQISTSKNNQIHSIKIKNKFNDAIAEEIATWLVERMYL